jgi:D-alanyl-D-alanine carboxypeptidase
MVRKVKKKKSKPRILLSFLLMVVIAVFASKYIITPIAQHLFEKYVDDRTTPVPSLRIGHDAAVGISPDRLNSPHAILIRLKDHTILMQKNSEEKIYPASLTKMMTAIIAIEKLPDLKKEIKLTNSTFQGLFQADASMAGFQPGDLNTQNIIGGEILGGKTGYTDEAGLCLASLAKVGKQEYILISAGAKGDHHSEQYNITDALAVYNSIRK